VLATWLLAVPIYALFPVAPPRLAGYIFDIIAGLLVSALGYLVGPAAARLMESTTAAVAGRRPSLALVET
jgi:hypothetical protein